MSPDEFLLNALNGREEESHYSSVVRRESSRTPNVEVVASEYPSVIRESAREQFVEEICAPVVESPEIDEAFSRPIVFDSEREACQEAIRQLSFWSLFCRPWSVYWKWIFGFGAIACLLTGLLASSDFIPHEIYAFLMALTVPMTMVTFFCELDVTRSVSGWTAAAVAFLGGIVTVTLAAMLNIGLEIEAWMAGLTEEPIKGLALLMLAMFPRQFPGILSGVALGVSIGAGFAVLETFEYAYAFGEAGRPDTFVLLLRGFLSPLMHMAWTGALGGAMWAARGPERTGWAALASWQFWAVFGAMVLFHCIWNGVGLINYLAVALWSIIFYYLKRGFAEVSDWELEGRIG